MLELIIATTNKGKLKEFRELLSDLPVLLRGLEEFQDISEPEETGQSFLENAELKAVYYALAAKKWTLADDSGLEVEALENAPGVFSARYSGKNSSDKENISKLLTELDKTANKERKARFVCEMALSDETGQIKFRARGICTGKIAGKPKGNYGFGYDPVFIPEGFSETFGELPNDLKQEISHRAKATQKIIEFLSDFLA